MYKPSMVVVVPVLKTLDPLMSLLLLLLSAELGLNNVDKNKFRGSPHQFIRSVLKFSPHFFIIVTKDARESKIRDLC